jgi:molybdenum cofactor cytidylyltransferase
VALSLRQGSDQGVVVPCYKGERGHPVGFSAGCGFELMALTGDEGARKVMKAHAPLALAVEDAGCVLDVDTVARLAQAEALFHSRERGRGEAQ